MNPTRDLKSDFDVTLKRLRIVHLALMSGMIILAIVALRLQTQPLMNTPGNRSSYVFLVPVLSLAGYFSGLFVFRWMLKPITPNSEFAQKLTRYQSASLLQYSCLEVPALVALYAYIAEGHVFYAAIASFLILYLFALYPTYAKMLRKLPLNQHEKKALS